MAEGLFEKLVSAEPGVESLGSAGVAAYAGDLISKETAVILKEKGVNEEMMKDFRSREVTEELLTEATDVFAMTESHLDMLAHAFPDFTEKYHLVCDFVSFNGKVGVDVPDPIGQGPKAYQMVASVFENALPCVLQWIKEDGSDE